jgi:Kef-type K+ transport system membrane component KefB
VSTTDLPLTAVLLTLAIVVAAAQAGGALFARLGQPRVVGEIVAGIALGPSLLGLLAPGAPEALVPAETRPFLSVLASSGSSSSCSSSASRSTRGCCGRGRG